jgi:hypothetical protein
LPKKKDHGLTKGRFGICYPLERGVFDLYLLQKKRRTSMKRKAGSIFRTGLLQLLMACCLVLVALGSSQAGNSPDDFVTLYPGKITEKEKALYEEFLAGNKAIEERGPVDLKALIAGTLPEDTPGIGPVLEVTEEMVRYNNEKYDPENPVLNVSEYAKKLGYENIFAYPTFAPNDDSIMKAWPSSARDALLVSDLNHNITYYRPIYPGDKIYTVLDRRTIRDITPEEGAKYRSIAMESVASLYNQKGEKVNTAIFRVTENLGILKEGKTFISEGGGQPGWVSPAWTSREAHQYTDADWKKIKKLWAAEKRQGSTPLYWEDVEVGDYPTVTVDGPVMESVNPTQPYGMGTGGSKTLKAEIMDADTFKTLVKDENGIYLTEEKSGYVPTVPSTGDSGRGGGMPSGGMPAGMPQGGIPGGDMGGAPGGMSEGGMPGGAGGPGGDMGQMPEGGMSRGGGQGSGDIDTSALHASKENERSVLFNFMGRDFAIRHINNWMGDYGWVYNIRWSIMAPSALEAVGLSVPDSPFSERYVQRVPSLVKAGKTVNAHGLTTDLAIVHSYVEKKYVQDGEFFVDLVWWVETIEGDIWEEGGATVKLPSKYAD